MCSFLAILKKRWKKDQSQWELDLVFSSEISLESLQHSYDDDFISFREKMLDHLDPKCQLVELICGSVFSHAHELSTNLCEMEISRVGGAWSHSLVHTVHTVLISQAWQWKVFFCIRNFSSMTPHWPLCIKLRFSKSKLISYFWCVWLMPLPTQQRHKLLCLLLCNLLNKLWPP